MEISSEASGMVIRMEPNQSPRLQQIQFAHPFLDHIRTNNNLAFAVLEDRVFDHFKHVTAKPNLTVRVDIIGLTGIAKTSLARVLVCSWIEKLRHLAEAAAVPHSTVAYHDFEWSMNILESHGKVTHKPGFIEHDEFASISGVDTDIENAFMDYVPGWNILIKERVLVTANFDIEANEIGVPRGSLRKRRNDHDRLEVVTLDVTEKLRNENIKARDQQTQERAQSQPYGTMANTQQIKHFTEVIWRLIETGTIRPEMDVSSLQELENFFKLDPELIPRFIGIYALPQLHFGIFGVRNSEHLHLLNNPKTDRGIFNEDPKETLKRFSLYRAMAGLESTVEIEHNLRWWRVRETLDSWGIVA